MEIGGAGRARVGLSGERDVGKKDEGREEKRPRSEERVDISTIGKETATVEEDSRRKFGLAPTNPSTRRLIGRAAYGDGVSNGVHDVVAVGVRAGVGLGVLLGRGRRGTSRGWGVPCEGWDAVSRVRDVGWVAERINGGRSLPWMVL